MYRQQNQQQHEMRDRRLGMKNTGRINKTGFNTGGHFRNPNNQGGDNCHRTVTVQSRMGNMNFGQKPPNIFDRNYNDNDNQWNNNNNSSGPNSGHGHFNQPPANMNYEQQNRDRFNQQERNFGGSMDMAAIINNFPTKPKSRLFTLIEKLKLYTKDKPYSHNDCTKVLVEAIHAAETSYTLDYSQIENERHRFKFIVENIVLGVGKSVVKKKARLEAYYNTLKRLKIHCVEELMESGWSDNPEGLNKLSNQADIQREDSRPLSDLVIIETQKTATRREKHAMSILRRSVYFSKMDLTKQISVVGNVHKVTISVQNVPVGIGLGSSVTKASVNAAADALFNNFYRRNHVLQMLDEDDCNKWIPWSKIRFLAKEIALIAGAEVSDQSLVTAIQKLVDTHPWSEVNKELIFGPGMNNHCIKMLYNFAKERNLSFEGRRDRQLGTYYVIQRYYDPLHVVRCLENSGGKKGNYRLLPKSEIFQIRCDHWEPTYEVWKPEEAAKKAKNSVNFNKPRGPRTRGKNGKSRRIILSKSVVESKLGIVSDTPKVAVKDDKEFGRMPNLKEREVTVKPHSNDKYFMPNNNDARFDPKFTQDSGFKGGEFRQMSRSASEFRPMSDSCDREPKQMPRPDDRGFRQMPQSDDRGFRQMPQSDDRGFGHMRQTDSEEFGQGRWHDNKEFGQMHRPGDREFGQMSQPNYEESNQTSWQNRREFNQMPGSHDREFRETSRPDAQEFRRMNNHEEQGFNRTPGLMEREFSHDNQNKTLGHEERRFNTNYGYNDQISDRNEREFNSQFRCNDRDRGHSYDDNYKQVMDVNNERFTHNPYENNHDKSFGNSNVELHQSSNYDRRFNENFDFDKQVSQPDNRNYNQLLQQNTRDYDQVSCDQNRLYSQVPNQDDRRLRFNNDQLTRMDHQKHQMNQNEPIDANRMQNNAPWNKMQNQRGGGRVSAANSRIGPSNSRIHHGPPQEMKQQNMMNVNQAANKNQLTTLRFLTKKIALHANVKGILANARRLSNIAKARSQVEKPSTVGKGIEAKTAPFALRVSQNSKVIKKSSGIQQSALNTAANRRRIRTRNGKRISSQPTPKVGNAVSKVGNAVPKVGNAVPKVGNAVPKVGNAVPKVGNAVPKVGNAVPKVGNAVPKVGKAVPKVGNAVPKAGNTVQKKV